MVFISQVQECTGKLKLHPNKITQTTGRKNKHYYSTEDGVEKARQQILMMLKN